MKAMKKLTLFMLSLAAARSLCACENKDRSEVSDNLAAGTTVTQATTTIAAATLSPATTTNLTTTTEAAATPEITTTTTAAATTTATTTKVIDDTDYYVRISGGYIGVPNSYSCILFYANEGKYIFKELKVKSNSNPDAKFEYKIYDEFIEYIVWGSSDITLEITVESQINGKTKVLETNIRT